MFENMKKKTIRITESGLANLIKKILKEDLSTLPELEGQTESSEAINNIECIQKALKKANLGNLLGTTGPNKDGIDGIYGKLTKRAVQEFQKNNGIKQTGFVGTVTAPKMGCKSMSKSPTKKIEPIKKDDEKKEEILCPSIAKSPNFREKQEMINFWRKKYNLENDSKTVELIDRMINRDAKSYMTSSKKPISKKTACEVASVGNRPKYKDKFIFIIDSPSKWITLYDKASDGVVRKIIAQNWIIDGMSKQRNDALSIATAFTTLGHYWDIAYKKHPNWDGEKLKDEMYRLSREAGGDFLPAGIYSGTEITSAPDYYGKTNNLLDIKNWNNQEISQAIHGFYGGDERKKYAELAMKIVKNPDDVGQQQNFLKQLKSGGLKMDWSYGCINLAPDFLPYLQKYGPGSIIFNIDETNENYLVQNTENFIKETQKSDDCQSVASLGGEKITNNV